MREFATLFTALSLLAVPRIGPAEEGANIPEPNPQAKVESVRGGCVDKYGGQSLGELSAEDYCTVLAWSELGRLYPELLEVARKLEREYNARGGKLTEVRKQLRREREQTDRLSAELGEAREKNRRLEGRLPNWLTWTLTAVGFVAGGAAGYGLGQLFSRREQAVSAGGLAGIRTGPHRPAESRRRA